MVKNAPKRTDTGLEGSQKHFVRKKKVEAKRLLQKAAFSDTNFLALSQNAAKRENRPLLFARQFVPLSDLNT